MFMEGSIRALLCLECNRLVGKHEKGRIINSDIKQQIIDYLNKYDDI